MPTHDFTLYDMLQRNAAAFPNRPAVLWDSECLTFRAFLRRVDALATGLAELSIATGDRLCILAQNSPGYLELYGACARLGLVAYPINWRLTAEEISRIVERAAPRLMLVDDAALALVAEWPTTKPSIPYWYKCGTDPAADFTLFSNLYLPLGASEPPEVHPDDPFAVISTAAVDVIPRGAVLTHTNLLASNLQTIACMGLSEADCNLLALPLFHVTALHSALAVMHAGGANVIMPRFDADQAVRLIDAHRVTYVSSFAPVLTNLLDAAERAGSTLPTLKHVAGLESPDAITRLHHNTSAQFWTGFGQTETTGFVTLQRVADHPGSAGKAAPLCRVKLVDDDDREVPVGTPGEIVVRGPVVFQGYFSQPDVTAYTCRGGWHHTGDIGRFDEQGYLYYVQRKPEKELIKPGGENVYPAEVESVIRQMSDVTGVCVFGVPDPQWGEAIKAVVETTDSANLSAEQVSEFVASKIARFKRPKWVTFTTALPRNAEGLVDREAVKATWGGTN
ncbi:MAG TPA: AMP-binding protein [Candidatus Tectomicrobia bacterium]|jgi:long-chain acyl-CoA synthetase